MIITSILDQFLYGILLTSTQLPSQARGHFPIHDLQVTRMNYSDPLFTCQ